jgi:hypothetical protein
MENLREVISSSFVGNICVVVCFRKSVVTTLAKAHKRSKHEKLNKGNEATQQSNPFTTHTTLSVK